MVNFRPALKSDCVEIARLYRISSEGVADYIWSKLAEVNGDFIQVGRRRYEREGADFSFENCTLVEEFFDVANQKNIVGMMVAFPMYIDPKSVEEDPFLHPFSVLEED